MRRSGQRQDAASSALARPKALLQIRHQNALRKPGDPSAPAPTSRILFAYSVLARIKKRIFRSVTTLSGQILRLPPQF